MSTAMSSANPRRTGSPGRSSGGLSDKDKPVEIDYQTNPDAYFAKLVQLKTYADTVRKQDSDQEKTLMEYLPVNEKFNLNKEGKVIARWQERQRDWEKIQAQIKRRLTSKVQKPLMMSTTDEYRARIEEYDLLQAAVPLKDRFSSSSWQVMLRGGGPIRVAVGHIFSGIECEVDLELPKPKMVRKPKPMSTVGQNDTFVDQTANFLGKLKKYEHSVKEIRPHNLTYSEANHLVIKSTNLFNWAKESSARYFQEQNELAGNIATMSISDEQGNAIKPGMNASIDGSVSIVGATPSFHGETLGSKIDFFSAKEVVFDALVGKQSVRNVTFRNCGSASVIYKWRRVPISSATKYDTDGTTLNGVLNAKGIDDGALRARNLSKNRECFFCLKETGEVLPDEEVSTVFTFTSCTGGGSFNSDWILEFFPEETAVYQIGATGAASGQGGASPGGEPTPPPMSVGSVTLRMKGHCLSNDESFTRRADLSSFLDAGAVTAVARDVVYSCLRRVRDPVRLPDLQNRQIALFRRTNIDLLNALSARFGSMLPLFITPERLEMFAAVYQQSSQAVVAVRAALAERRAHYATLPATSRDAAIDISAVDATNPLALLSVQVAQLRAAVFPEELIEIFDEVSEEQLLPSWSYDLSGLLTVLTALLAQCQEIGTLEEKIAEYDAGVEKARLKAERLAARMAALDSDDELEPEEEEEENDADEEDLPAKPVHPFVTQAQHLISEVHSTLHLLVTHPLPETDLYNIVSQIVGDIAGYVVDHHEKALEVCELQEMVQKQGVVIPNFPSPFTSAEGHAAWKHALAQTSHIAEPEGGDKKKPPPKPAKGAAPPSEPTKQQIDYFYKLMHDGVRGSLLDLGVTMFERVEQRLQRDAMLPLTRYNTSLTSLFNVAAPRKDDLAASTGGKVAFVSFNGMAFTEQANVRSAFDVNLAHKRSAVAPVLKLIEHQAKAIVLVYESPSTLANAAGDAILPYFEEIKSLISQQRADFIAKTNKALRKLKQKPPSYKELVFSKYASFAEFYYHTDNLLREQDPAGDGKGAYFTQNIPIFLIENVLVPGVVPPEPLLEDVPSDDDEAPVLLGIEESVVKKRQDWEARRPHRVQVALDLTATTAGAPKRGSAKQMPPSVKVECYADAAAAITEAYSLMTTKTGGEAVWIDGTLCKLYDPASVLPALDRNTVSTRLVSEEVRDAYLWTGVLQLMPQSVNFLRAPATPAPSTGDAAIDTTSAGPLSTNELITQHFARLFPYSALQQKAPRATVVLGGSIRAEKFVALDQLIDLVDTIFLVGEFALPFLCLSKRYSFTRYALPCAQYHGVCSTLLAKARMRGCQLRWPIDMVMGDTEVKADDRMKCFLKVEPDARNEGADYDGEAKVFKVSDAEVDALGVDEVKLSGHAYDIGPETCAALKATLLSTDLVVVWGTVGVCESSAFQAGQQCLVDFGSTKKAPEPPAPVAVATKAAPPVKGAPPAAAPAPPAVTKNPLRTVLVGDSTVEWFTRFLDSDGELQGDLVGAGRVSFATRESCVFAGLMGLLPSRMAQSAFVQRTPLECEFVYSTVRSEQDEEEEEEEEEDEEDD